MDRETKEENNRCAIKWISGKAGNMAVNERSIEILKTHKRWADVYSLISIVLVVGLVAITAVLADAANTDMATRVGMFVTMTAVVIIVSVWQAAGLAVARIHKIMLEQHDAMRLGR
jgi:Kef-type K+ transport system membrane component KefB